MGFNEECLAFYNSTSKTPNELLYPQYGGEVGNWNVENHLISTPLYQQAFRWFREKYNIVHEIVRKEDKNHREFIAWVYAENDKIEVVSYWYALSYEESKLACLKKLIEIVKNK